jgi:hypothetical protein
MMAMKFRHHKYTWSKPFGSAKHSWEFVGPEGGISYNASIYEGRAMKGDTVVIRVSFKSLMERLRHAALATPDVTDAESPRRGDA